MTYLDVINEMLGKKFYSESFGDEVVLVSGVQVVGESSGRLNLLSTKLDVRDLYEDYKKSMVD